jgi:serine/threonine protein phosphatase 1
LAAARLTLTAMIELVPAPATLPSGQRVYAVGDVHGCFERLVAMHEHIAADLADRPVEHTVLVHLGDYVDRGMESAQVVEWLRAGPPVPAQVVVNLMGNHEQMMLAAIAMADKDAGELWLRNGGADSLMSWGVPRSVPQQDWASYIPVPHLVFLRDLALHHRIGPYLFIHAGLRPGVPMMQQARHDLLWIREPFLSSKADHGAVVVHGHSPRREPYVGKNRIGIDTGAVIGGALTCVVLEGDQLGFLHT